MKTDKRFKKKVKNAKDLKVKKKQKIQKVKKDERFKKWKRTKDLKWEWWVDTFNLEGADSDYSLWVWSFQKKKKTISCFVNRKNQVLETKTRLGSGTSFSRKNYFLKLAFQKTLRRILFRLGIECWPFQIPKFAHFKNVQTIETFDLYC